MARKFSLTQDDIEAIQKKLRKEKDKLPKDEAELLEALLNKAKKERKILKTAGPGWLFTWTYRF